MQLILKNANVVLVGKQVKHGKNQDIVKVEKNCDIVVDDDGVIVYIGQDSANFLPENSKVQTVDCSGKCVLPGFVDGHTHPVWSGSRVDEFRMKLAGATYMEVHASGGGIYSTVQSTVESSKEELTELLRKRLNRMLSLGTTLIEAKSGYGLDIDTEIKMLQVMHECKHYVEIVANYLGAHTPPKGMAAKDAAKDIVQVHLGRIKDAMDRNEISPALIDVFCEKGVFEFQDTKDILEAGKKIGLKANFHGDEIHCMKSGKLASEVHALAVSHLEMVDKVGIQCMAKHNPPIIAVVLPTTKYILNLPNPPVRQMIEAGVPVALGTDFNPNAHCMSMPMAMNMACVLFKMTMNESLVAGTINAAASMGKSDMYGSIDVGKYGDFVIVDAPQWEHVIYEMVDPPICAVYKKGKQVYESNRGAR